MTTRTLSVVLPDADYAKIRESAMKHHLPLSSYVRSIVMRHINGDLSANPPHATQPAPTMPTPKPAPTVTEDPQPIRQPQQHISDDERDRILKAFGG